MILENIYDVNAMDRFLDSCNKQKFKDASTGILLSRDLTKVDPTIFEKKYPENVFLNSGFTADNTGGYATAIESLRISGQGGFKDATDPDEDKGTISLSGETSLIAVAQRGTRTKWTDTEVQRALLGGYSITSRYMETVDMKYKQELDTAGLVGLRAGQTGVLNYSGVTPIDLGSTQIGDGTAIQDYNIIANFINTQRGAVYNTPEYMGNILYVPVTVYNHLQKTILAPDAGNGSVLYALQQNFPEISIVATFRAENVGGVRVMSLVSNNPQVMKFRVPVPLKSSPITQLGFEFFTDYAYHLAGIDVLETAGIQIGSDI